MNQALTCLIGLFNGAVFRRFSFRQVSFFGATLVAVALFFTSFANSFLVFLITFSILYGNKNNNNKCKNGLFVDEKLLCYQFTCLLSLYCYNHFNPYNTATFEHR